MSLQGTFQITDWQESVVQQLKSNKKLSTASIKQSYSGGITGESQAEYTLWYEENGDAAFNGFEVINASIGDEKCQLILKHDGKFTGGIASSHFTVVQTEPPNKLVGIKGSFTSGEAGQATYSFV